MGCAVSSSLLTFFFFLISSRKHRLTRTQSAFSPVVFSPLFTGEDLEDGFSFWDEKSSVRLTADAERGLRVQTGISVRSPSVPLGLKPRTRGAVKDVAVARQRFAIPPVETRVCVALSEGKGVPPRGAVGTRVVWKTPCRSSAVWCSPPAV